MKKILNIKELAQYLGCSVSTIRNLIKNSDFPFCRIGVKYYFIVENVESWLEKNGR